MTAKKYLTAGLIWLLIFMISGFFRNFNGECFVFQTIDFYFPIENYLCIAFLVQSVSISIYFLKAKLETDFRFAVVKSILFSFFLYVITFSSCFYFFKDFQNF